jgi:GxxExxY protein
MQPRRRKDAKTATKEKQVNVYEFHERRDVRVDSATEGIATLTIGAAIEVHRHLGPGLPEISYRKALSHELKLQSIRHHCEFPVPIVYKGVPVGDGKVDVLIAEKLVLEIKVVEILTAVHRAQTIAYLQALKLPLGLLVNFNVAILRDGVKRVINTF